MKKFMTLLLALVMTASLCLVGCAPESSKAVPPESVEITNSSFTLSRGENVLTATVKPEKASQEVNWSIVGTAPAGVEIDGDKITVSKNTRDKAEVSIKVAAKTDPTVSQTKKFTVNNPADEAIKISTEEELIAIGNDLTANYELTNDIELSKPWKPLGIADVTDAQDKIVEMGVGFKGTLNGNGYSIKNLRILAEMDGPREEWVDAYTIGFFHKIESTGIIENLGFESESDIAVYAASWGSVITPKNEGTIRNCFTDAIVHMDNTPGGAFLGSNLGTIEYCYAIGKVKVNRKGDNGEISPNTSGFVNANNGTIYESYVLEDSVEAAVGYHEYQDDAITKSSQWMRTAQNYKDAGWDEDIWYLADGFYPQLRHEDFTAPTASMQITNERDYLDYNSEDLDTLQIEYSVRGLLDESVEFSIEETDVDGVSISSEGLISLTEDVVNGTKFTVVVTSAADSTVFAKKEISVVRIIPEVYIEITAVEQPG